MKYKYHPKKKSIRIISNSQILVPFNVLLIEFTKERRLWTEGQ